MARGSGAKGLGRSAARRVSCVLLFSLKECMDPALAHEAAQDRWVEALIHLASEHSGRNVEPTSDLALCKTMYVLGDIMRQAPSFSSVLREIRRGYDREV
jgi:hypothetical protein